MIAKLKPGRMAASGALSMIGLAMMPAAASAHHPLGGATPDTFVNGLLSGLGHPVIGLDHLAFIVAAGIACALLKARAFEPALFIAATVVGCLLRVAIGAALPFAEFVIAASVLGIGAVVMSGRQVSTPALAALLGVAGLFHGSAYGEAIIGAETTPLVAYLIGFGLVQMLILTATAFVARALAETVSPATLAMQPRLAGAMVAGVGATFLIEHIERFAFPGM